MQDDQITVVAARLALRPQMLHAGLAVQYEGQQMRLGLPVVARFSLPSAFSHTMSLWPLAVIDRPRKKRSRRNTRWARAT